jgi:hypothetical protein
LIRRAAPAIAALLLAACGPRTAPPAIDPAMAACVPTDAATLAGLSLDALRRSPLLPGIPPEHRAFLESFRDARSVLVSSRGSDFLVIARGSLPGWTAAAPGLSLNGSPDLVRSATVRHAPSPLLDVAEPLAGRNPLWAVVRGGTMLPLQGNLANLNNLLRDVDYVTLVAQLDDRVALDLAASCPTPDAARHFEGSLRAVVGLSAAGMRQPDLAGLLRSVQVKREDRTVRASMAASPDALGRLLH